MQVFQERLYANHLQMLSAKTSPYSECLQYEPIDPNEPWLKLSKGEHFCLINQSGEGPCTGDSGGAIIRNHIQIGVVSFGVTFLLNTQSKMYPINFFRLTSVESVNQ